MCLTSSIIPLVEEKVIVFIRSKVKRQSFKHLATNCNKLASDDGGKNNLLKSNVCTPYSPGLLTSSKQLLGKDLSN